MSTTDIRETLDAVAAAAPVPPVDRLAFERQVRSARRRRTTTRALAAVAAACAVVAGLTVAAPWVDRPGSAGRDSAAEPAAGAGPRQTVAIAVRDRLAVLEADGTLHRSGLAVEEVLATTAAGAVVVGADSELLLVPLTADGAPGRPTALVEGAVQRAAVSPDGRTVAWVDLAGDAHVRAVASPGELGRPLRFDPTRHLAALDGTTLLSWDQRALTVHVGAREVRLASAERATGGRLAGGVVAYQTMGGTAFYDTDGTVRVGEVGGGVGGLSTDGRWYAAAPNDGQTDAGMANALEVYDTATGDRHQVSGWDGGGWVRTVSWLDDDRFLALVEDASGRRLLDCSRVAARCDERFADPSGSLEIATR